MHTHWLVLDLGQRANQTGGYKRPNESTKSQLPVHTGLQSVWNWRLPKGLPWMAVAALLGRGATVSSVTDALLTLLPPVIPLQVLPSNAATAILDSTPRGMISMRELATERFSYK